MTTPTTDHESDASDRERTSIHLQKFLDSKIRDLASQERDAVRRRDWSAARTVAEEKATLQVARQSALAKRLA